MRQAHIRYDTATKRVVKTFWGSAEPEWNSPTDGEADVRTAVKQTRQQVVRDTLNGVEAGTDYDPETEKPVAQLYYDPDTDELYGEVEIQKL